MKRILFLTAGLFLLLSGCRAAAPASAVAAAFTAVVPEIPVLTIGRDTVHPDNGQARAGSFRYSILETEITDSLNIKVFPQPPDKLKQYLRNEDTLDYKYRYVFMKLEIENLSESPEICDIGSLRLLPVSGELEADPEALCMPVTFDKAEYWESSRSHFAFSLDEGEVKTCTILYVLPIETFRDNLLLLLNYDLKQESIPVFLETQCGETE